MKNYFWSMALLLLSIALQAQETASLSGVITNPNGEEVYLLGVQIKMGRQVRVGLDTAQVDENGAFVLTAELDSTMSVSFYDGNEQMGILLSPGDDQYMTINTRYFDETIQFYGKGSEKNNAIRTIYLLDEQNTDALFEALEGDEPDTTTMFRKYEQNSAAINDLIRDYIANTDGFGSYGAQELKNQEMKAGQIKAYVRSQIEFKKALSALVNKPAVDFEGVDLEGNKVKLSDYKGKLIVVDFWATWCGPCKAEFPAYKELEKQYGQEVNFVSVGIYCDEPAWKTMATDEGFAHNIYVSKDGEAQVKPYLVNFIPRYLVIDPDFVLINAHAPRPSSGELESYWVK